MKLYTEEQVKEAMIEARISPWLKTDFLLQNYTPIELPSDEEIKAQVEPMGTLGDIGFIEGAKWVIEQIKQQ